MSEITVTLKGDGAPWIVVHGDTPEDTEQLLDAVAVLQEKVIALATDFHGKGNALAPARGNNRPPYNRASSPSAGAAPAGGSNATHYLTVPFDDAAGRQEVKDAGGRWNKDRKGWNVDAATAAKFEQYSPKPL